MKFKSIEWGLIVILFVTPFLNWFVVETKKQTGFEWLSENTLFLVIFFIVLLIIIISLFFKRLDFSVVFFSGLLMVMMFLIPFQRFNFKLFTEPTFLKIVLTKFIQWPFYVAFLASIGLFIFTILDLKEKRPRDKK